MPGVPKSQVFLFHFFFYHLVFVFNYMGTKSGWSASYGIKKPLIYPPRRQRKNNQPKSLWYGTNRTPATSNKKSNSDYLIGAKKAIQIKTWGGIKRKTLPVDTNKRKAML